MHPGGACVSIGRDRLCALLCVIERTIQVTPVARRQSGAIVSGTPHQVTHQAIRAVCHGRVEDTPCRLLYRPIPLRDTGSWPVFSLSALLFEIGGSLLVPSTGYGWKLTTASAVDSPVPPPWLQVASSLSGLRDCTGVRGERLVLPTPSPRIRRGSEGIGSTSRSWDVGPDAALWLLL
jgi:hypothetical protein